MGRHQSTNVKTLRVSVCPLVQRRYLNGTDSSQYSSAPLCPSSAGKVDPRHDSSIQSSLIEISAVSKLLLIFFRLLSGGFS